MAGSVDLQTLKRIAEERGVTPCHALFASFLASLAEAGILNQATVNFMARHAALILHGYLKALNMVRSDGKEAVERLKTLVASLNEALDIGESVEFREPEEGVVEIGIGGSRCRYCPRGVGRAEIPGTACPFPRLIEQVAQLEGINARYELITSEDGRPQALRRSGGLCWIRYRVEG